MMELADFWQVSGAEQERTKSHIKQLSQKGQNPCILLYGSGPKYTLCKECAHMRAITTSKTYGKCDLRMLTHGPGTDRRRNWPACARFEAIESDTTK